MITQFKAKIENENEVANVINTGLEKSKADTIYLMSNGEWIQIAHKEFKEELEAEGYWVASIFEYGHRVEA